MARLSRILSDWRVYVAVGYFVLALGIGFLAQQAASQERGLLIDFVCDSVRIRYEKQDPAAEEFAARFGKIMLKHDASCSSPVKGLP